MIIMQDNNSQLSLAKNSEILENFQFIPHEILDIRYLKEIDKLLTENSNLDMVLDFWAEWCSPCKLFSLIFEKLHKEFGAYFIFAKVSVEQDRRILYKYNITDIPTCIIIKNGKLVYMCNKITDYELLKETLNRYKNL